MIAKEIKHCPLHTNENENEYNQSATSNNRFKSEQDLHLIGTKQCYMLTRSKYTSILFFLCGLLPQAPKW
jgi:hypothetical protein